MITSFDDLLVQVRKQPKKTVAAAMAEDADVLKALSHANAEGIVDAVLVGHKQKIIEIADQNGIDISNFDIMHSTTENQAVIRSIQLVREHLADALMKGKCATATLLKGVLNKRYRVRSGNLLSHCAVLEVPTYHKLIFMTDGGMNIAPDLDTKHGILLNALGMAHKFKIEEPKVAVITAIEKVNYNAMQCTVDAAVLSQMARRKQIVKAIVDGPLAVDNAISKKACETKGIDSPVGGDADILLMPNIEAGNVFYKALNFLGKARTAGLVLGAKVPIILTSRADSKDTKFLSIATAMLLSGGRK